MGLGTNDEDKENKRIHVFDWTGKPVEDMENSLVTYDISILYQ